MKKIYFTLFFLSLLLKGFSTHIVGGSLTYTYNGGSNYTVMLKLYRDCSAAAAAFPATADITVLQANGSLFNPNRNFVLNGGAITSIPQVLPPCATSPSVVPCVEQRVYTATVSLVASPGGIHLYFDTFFRNGSINNIILPGAEGETFYAYIPCYNKIWTEDFNLLIADISVSIRINESILTSVSDLVMEVVSFAHHPPLTTTFATCSSFSWSRKTCFTGFHPTNKRTKNKYLIS